jgi:hypothetical protein
MKQGFQKVLKIKPPRDFFTSSGAFVFAEVICDGHRGLQT